MKKKFLTLGIAFLMLFSLAACNDFDLASYKAEAKSEIENYATESNYCTENWSIVCGIVETGKIAVDAAENKAGVDTAVNDTKSAIDSIEEEIVGAFYTLQEAYDEGLLTVSDLQNIANHFNNDTTPNDNLSSELQEAIKETRAEKLRNLNSNPISEATTDDVSIVKYYGSYSGAIAVIITDIYSNYGQGELPEYEVGGALFYNYGAPEIQIWKR